MSNIIIDPFRFGGFHNTTTNTQSFNFDGSGDFLELSDDDNWDFIDGSASSTDNEKHSFAFWLHRDSATGNFGIISKYNTGGANSYRHFYHSSGGNLLLDTYNGSGSGYKRRIFSGQQSGDWQHHVWVHDGNPTGWKLYINGSEVSSSSTGGSGTEMVDTTSSVRIGYANGLSDLNGQMCQFMAWKGIELDQAAVTYLYAGGTAMRNPTLPGNQGTGVYTQTQVNGLLAWLPMDDANGADDHSGSANGTHNFTKNGNCDVTTGSGNVPF